MTVGTLFLMMANIKRNKVMKANEAPEKLYFGESDKGILDIYSTKESDNEVEYTRTDAFIEKACEWLENNLQGIVGGSIYIDDFRKYMEGE